MSDSFAERLERPAAIDTAPLQRTAIEASPPGPGEIALRVIACGVCRTDLQLCEGDLPAHKLPITPGHQIVGRVEAIGEGVSQWKVGDRAGVAWLASACGKCAQCTAANENLCASATFTGWDRDGGYATHAIARADFALRIPERFGDVDAAPLLCGGVIGYRSLKRSRIRPGGKLGLYGFGASATLAIQIARHWGCRVFVTSRSRADLDRARALGAEWVGMYDEKPPEPLDAAVTFAPAGSVVRAALLALDRGATVAINAIHLDRVPELPYEALWWERTITSVANFTRADAREFLELAASIPIQTQFETHPLADANCAMSRLSRGEVNGAAVLVA
jgi:propanol-preferring alcohol dehydrogenase